MIKVQRHFNKGNPEIIRLCRLSKELYNKCNFFMRDNFSKGIRTPDISTLINLVKDEDCFKNLHNTKTAKQTIRQCLTDWTNFFRAMTAYKKNPEKFIRFPRPPKFKKEMAQVIFYNETIRRKPLKQGTIQPTNDCFQIKSDKPFKQVIITPKSFGFVIEVRYEEPDEPVKSRAKGICSIDLGVNNLAAITSDQHDPILINGRIVKSFNQWFNKKPNKFNSMKRYWRLENYFHHVSKMIVENCKANNVGTIIIGKNDGWKNEMNMGKKNNQTFQYIPFCRLIQKIQYKAEMAGVKVLFTEESYTSKASFIDEDPLDGSKISGKRIKRGLYQSREGRLINADVNGSLNICKKVIPEMVKDQWDRSVAATPVAVNPLRWFTAQT